MQEIDQIIDTRISVEWLILADAAEVTGGKLYLLGGGWDRLTVNSQPAKRSFAVALAFRVPWHETNRQHVFQIEMADADGRNALTVQGQFEVGRPAGIPQGQPQLIQLVGNVDATFEKLGTYVITARVNSEMERSIRFNVVAGPGLSQPAHPDSSI